MRAGVFIDVTRDGWTGDLQLSIGTYDENGAGHGHRIAGPKFNGSGENLLHARLTASDAAAIRSYLDEIEAPSCREDD